MTLRRNFLCLATMAALAIVAPLATTTIQAQSSCTNTLASLNGKYDWGGGGDYYTLALVDQPLSMVGYLTFDGAGNVTSGFFNQNLSDTPQGLTETGTYSENPDCSYTVTLNGTQARKFNVEASLLDPTTNVAQDDEADEVDDGYDIQMQGTISSDPTGGCQQSDLAGTYGGGFEGETSLLGLAAEKVSGDEQLIIDETGNVTGTGHESDNGANQADTITGNVAVSTDCSFSGTLTVNGVNEPFAGQMIFPPASTSASAAIHKAAQPSDRFTIPPSSFRSWQSNASGFVLTTQLLTSRY